MAKDLVYLQGSFQEKGQNSFIEAPDQNQRAFEEVKNVLPPDTGPFHKRFGYTQFHNTGNTTRRLYEYQKDADGSRRIILASTDEVSSINEDGTDHLLNIFTPDGAATEDPRRVVSRDFAFFQDGASADRLRWDGTIQNFILESQTIDLSPWVSSQTGGAPGLPTVTANATTAPDGTMTAEQIDFPLTAVGETSTRAQGGVTPPITPNNTFTLSIWLRTDSPHSLLTLNMTDAPLTEQIQSNPSLTTAWQRFTLTKAWGSGVNATFNIRLRSENKAAFTIFTWGAKLEYGSVATGSFDSYGVTTTAALTGGIFDWGIDEPSTAVGVGAPSAGAVTLELGRKYFLVFRKASTGHNSDLSPVSATTGPVTAQDIPLSAIEVSTDPQVDRKLVLATPDGGDETTLYFLADIPNSQTTLTDDIPELTLIAGNLYLDTDAFGVEHGVTDNDRPPTLTLLVKHRGRIWGAGNTENPQFVFYSKSISDLTTGTGTIAGRYEEAWPATNFFDISAGAETVRALFSDGITLYVGTERHIRRIFGDGQTFINPSVLFNNVGVVNQDVWKTVFIEGAPAGTMFLTPDKKVMFTDFNTYRDLGFDIQDVLSTINTAAIDKSYAEVYSSEGDDWYMLAVPTGANTEPDTLLVFDLKSKQWYPWALTDKVTALLSNIKADGTIQLLFAGDDSRLHKLADASTQDREGQTPDVAASFTSTMTTTWRHFDSPHAIKLLNKLKFFSSDATITAAVDGASTRSEFTTPASVLTATAPTTGPLGDFEVYLAGKVSKDRFYRFKFVSSADLSSSTAPVLSYFEAHHRPYTVFS